MARRRDPFWGLGKPPSSAAWPRLMTGAHPKAVGSYGAEMVAWAEQRRLHPKRSETTRWWQKLAAYRALEHDSAGRLVWPMVIVSAPRQSGKSWLERMICAWRIHQGERWGEEQNLLHVAHKLIAAQEVWRPAARWASGHVEDMLVRRASGEERIELADGSRWMIQAATDGAGVAFSLCMALIDEGWRIPRRVFDEAIEPTLAEAESPQAWLVSTAGTSESDLMMVNRAAALETIDEPRDTLLLEWSAPPDQDLDVDDPKVWRACQPHWDERRAERMAIARRNASERAFRQQWLNQWVPGLSGPLLGEDVWKRVQTGAAPGDPLGVGCQVAWDRSAACVVVTDGVTCELVEYREGAAWAAGRVAELAGGHAVVAAGVHRSGPSAAVADECAEPLGERLVALSSGEMAAASAKVFDRLTASPPLLRLRTHPHLANAVMLAERAPGSGGWAWSRDGAGMVLSAVSAAVWALEHALAEDPLVFV